MVELSAPHFLSGCQLVGASDYLLTLPRKVAYKACEVFDLKWMELPFELDGFSTSIHWHRRYDQDPAHQAFRDLIENVCKDL